MNVGVGDFKIAGLRSTGAARGADHGAELPFVPASNEISALVS